MPEFSDQPSPGKNLSCIELLQLVLDGDATPEQHAQFEAHIAQCMPCYQTYNLDITVRALLKTKCSGNGAPPELIEKIKSKISQNLPH
jgi:anti-sigma factor (TIGR02949 family)